MRARLDALSSSPSFLHDVEAALSELPGGLPEDAVGFALRFDGLLPTAEGDLNETTSVKARTQWFRPLGHSSSGKAVITHWYWDGTNECFKNCQAWCELDGDGCHDTGHASDHDEVGGSQ